MLWYILYTCPKLWCNSCSKCYGMDCFGTNFTHVQSCDVTRVRSATEWNASVHTSHMSKAVIYNSCSKCYWMECFGTYFTHVQSFDVTHNGAHNGPDSAKTDVMRKTRTLHALLLRAAENQCFTTTRASFCVCTPLKFRYGFFRSVQDKVHLSLW